MADKGTIKKVNKKTSKAIEVKTLEQLLADLATAQDELHESRKSHAAGELVNPRVITVKKKEIARLKTAIVAQSRKENA